jgi:hypothetical protein
MPIYSGMSNKEYHSRKELSSSGLEHLERSPAHFQAYLKTKKEPTDAMRQGTAFHTAVLEPGLFDYEIAISPKCDRRTKKGKADFAEFQAKAEGCQAWITEDQAETVKAMAEAVRNHPDASDFLSNGHAELSVIWQEAAAGCRCRPDYLNQDTIVELKSSLSADPNYFSRDAVNRGYHLRAGFYYRGLYLETGKRYKFKYIVCENSEPYGVNVYPFEQVFLDYEAERAGRLIDLYSKCVKEDRWPGYDNELKGLNIPKWYMERNYE